MTHIYCGPATGWETKALNHLGHRGSAIKMFPMSSLDIVLLCSSPSLLVSQQFIAGAEFKRSDGNISRREGAVPAPTSVISRFNQQCQTETWKGSPTCCVTCNRDCVHVLVPIWKEYGRNHHMTLMWPRLGCYRTDSILLPWSTMTWLL